MSTNANLEKFKEWKNTLNGWMNRSKAIFLSLGMKAEYDNTEGLIYRVSQETFKVMIVGEFKVGKSTFINALFGKKVLPAYSIACTAAINEIKYGQNPRSVLHFRQDIHLPLPQKLDPVAQEHIMKFHPEVPVLEIPIDALTRFVTITDHSKKQKDSVAESPYEMAEIFWPLELCADNVEIIDSPGLNEDKRRTAITLRYLSKADAIIFVISSLQPISATEFEFLENNILRTGHEYVFFLFNRFHQVPQAERADLKRVASEQLAGKTKDDRYILFADSQEALDAQLENKPTTNSGLDEIKDLLADFLTHKKGTIKLLAPLTELQTYVLYARQNAIPDNLKPLDKSIEELEKNLKAAQPLLADLTKQKEQIISRLNQQIVALESEIERTFKARIYEIITLVPKWIAEIQLEKEFKTFSPKESAKEILEELIQKFQERNEAEQTNWGETVLSPLINDRLLIIKSSFEANVVDLFIKIDKIKMQISGDLDAERLGIVRDVSALERIGAAIAGLLVADFGSGLVGANFGFSKQFFKQMALQVGAVVTMLLIGITNPFTIIPVIIAIAWVGIIQGKEIALQKLKAVTAEKIVEDLHVKLEATAKQQTKDVMEHIKPKVKPIESSLDKNIATVSANIDSILKTKREGEEKVKKRKEELAAFDKELLLLSNVMKDFKDMLESVA